MSCEIQNSLCCQCQISQAATVDIISLTVNKEGNPPQQVTQFNYSIITSLQPLMVQSLLMSLQQSKHCQSSSLSHNAELVNRTQKYRIINHLKKIKTLQAPKCPGGFNCGGPWHSQSPRRKTLCSSVASYVHCTERCPITRRAGGRVSESNKNNLVLKPLGLLNM